MVVTRSQTKLDSDRKSAHLAPPEQANLAEEREVPPAFHVTSKDLGDQADPVAVSDRSCSNYSSTLKAKKLAAAAQHARRLAEIEKRAAELEFQAEIANIEAESERASHRTRNNSIAEWLMKSEAHEAAQPQTWHPDILVPQEAAPRSSSYNQFNNNDRLSLQVPANNEIPDPHRCCTEFSLVKTLENIVNTCTQSRGKVSFINLPHSDGKSVHTFCGINGCKYKHHQLLHKSNHTSDQSTHIDLQTTQPTVSSQNHDNSAHLVEGGSMEVSAHTATTSPKTKLPLSQTLLKMIAVTVTGPIDSIDTYALLDDGSTATFIDSDIATRIGTDGPTSSIRINCMGGLSKVDTVKFVNFTIKGINSDKSYNIHDARSINNLGVATQYISKDDIGKYSHLDDLVGFFPHGEITPKIIIGMDNWHLIIARDIRKSTSSQPAAIYTALGWVLFGFTSSRTKPVKFESSTTNHISSKCLEVESTNLDNLIKDYYKLDSIGIVNKDHRGISDTHALEILEKTTRRLPCGRFESGLLWRPKISDVPNNFNLALSRLLSLEHKMSKDCNYARLYKTNIQALFDKGYTEECTKPPVGVTWYLPHFGVTHAHKPDKLRIVHDAAATFKGISLNSLLLPGPDLLQPLLAILMRFREDPIALMADIKEMFPQIKIREQDRDALRFLWRDNSSQPIKVFRMSSMIFGACSSPCTALYVQKVNAKDFENEFPLASKAIITDTYMDDYIASVSSVEEATRLAYDIVTINKRGGFEMRGWISNDPTALSLIPKELLAVQPSDSSCVDIGHQQTIVRTLGLIWKPLLDFISFNTGLNKTVMDLFTKRTVLASVMRIYDPLGILAPIVIRGRILFQNIWRKGLNWDENLSQADTQLWKDWINDLSSISKLQIPRFYGLKDCETKERELHIFCDASELAYAAVAYWRIIYLDNTKKLSLICSKARVSPLKPTSIPRLELQGALVAARLASYICSAHKYKPDRRIFWCDSLTTLAWLRSDARSFKPFVAHRLSEILDLTNVSEWRWVPTAQNVADDATHLKRILLTDQSRWITGPEFLLGSNWPQQPQNLLISTDDSEIKTPTHCHFTSLDSSSSPLVAEAHRFSSWSKLLRITARCHKFINLLRYKTGPKDLTTDDLRTAEVHLLRQSQIDTFSEELTCLRRGQMLSKKSRLFNLTPIIGEDKLMRLSGRIDRAPEVNDDLKQPIILDSKHPAVRLLIDHFHKKFAHANCETVINEMRQLYWILNLRSTVKSISRNCQFCRLLRAKPFQPPEGDLPEARLRHHRRPFTFVGLDYFGPIQVVVGRKRDKRYVALYTCLVTRGVHLEVVHNLSADAALMSLRRFIGRRGTPSEIYSDNGTAFVGVNRLLRKLYGEAVTNFTVNESIQWHFIPPSAPFMGGAWERLVRSIKTALKVTLKTHTPTDEILQTLLIEAEALVNSRPLTHVPADPCTQEALTPFNFIFGSTSGRPIPVTLDDSSLISRVGWRKAVRLADHFWRRWVSEYLPSLLPRRGGGKIPDISIGDPVLIADGNMPRGTWPRGVIQKVFRGHDGIARVADVRTSAGVLKRPLKKLVPL